MYALLGVFHPIAHLPCPSLELETNCVPYRFTRFSAAPPLTKCISIYRYLLFTSIWSFYCLGDFTLCLTSGSCTTTCVIADPACRETTHRGLCLIMRDC
jgi:hypothetical protein